MKKNFPFILLILFSTIFIFYFYGNVILHPDNYLFNGSGDGLKNYFTYYYHIKHDISYINFGGMNYPYGEHFLYTDCHPILVVCFKFLSSQFDFFSSHSIGILNFLMILSIFLTFFVCYFLLREFNINRWFSLLYCIGITLLAPQLFRLGGHLALSYSIAIPLSWLLIIKCFKNKGKFIYSVILFFNNLFWLFIHAYLGIIILFFLGSIIVVKYQLDKDKRKEIAQYLRIAFAIFIPVIIFYLFAILTDTHTGRTTNPTGFFLFNAELDDVFLPHYPSLSFAMNEFLDKNIKTQWEAWGYVGFSTTIIFAVILILSIIKLFKRNKVKVLSTFFNSELLNVSLISGFIVLLFAMAIPFKQIPSLVDFIPIIKQFRATGRFTWPFYFVAIVFAANVMQEIYLKSNTKRKKIFILLLCITVGLSNIVEGIPYHMDVSSNIVISKNLFKKEFLSDSYKAAINSVNLKEYQAIISLPFYYQGSENFSRHINEETARASIYISYHTGIPIVCANLTRISIQESKNIIQIVSPNFYKKEILKDLPSNKPFLVIRTKDEISNYEKDIFFKCKPIYQSDEISLYILAKEDLFKNNAFNIYEKYKQIQSTLFKKNQFYLSSDSSFFYYNGFENLKSDKPFRGKGGFQSIKKGKNTFAEFPPYTFKEGKKYHISMWMFNGFQDALNDYLKFIIEEYDEERNTWKSTTCFPIQSEVIYGNWSLVETVFAVEKSKNKISIVTKGKDSSKKALFADDLLIVEEGVDVYSLNKQKNILFYNNHEIFLK
ncbi:MAG: hypothetical protein HXX18_03270 [Bacteroidetes bacterium]|nr:hypothetical protein [Bacteroidota bacterium]